MRKKIFFIVLLFIVTTVVFAAAAPEFTIEPFQGARIRSSALLEKGPIFLTFWADWCVPCKQELPHVSDFVKKFPDISFVAISIDAPRHKEKASTFVRSRRFEFISAYDGDTRTLQRLFNVTNPPHTIIINQAGEIVYNQTSYTAGDEAKYEEILNGLSNQ